MKKLLSVILALSMILSAGFSTCIVYADNSNASQEEDIDKLLEAGEYEPHRAIALVRRDNAPASLFGTDSMKNSNDLLSSAVTLMDISEDVYREMGGVVPAAQSIPDFSVNGVKPFSFEEFDSNVYEVVLVEDDTLSTKQILGKLLNDDRVLFAEPDYIVKAESADSTAVDLRSYQWANKISSGIGADGEWFEGNQQNTSCVVAVVDSGIDYNHPDLADVMYHIPEDVREYIPGCGEFGIDYVNDDDDPMDDCHHGTHCAGIIAGAWNEYGISGVANGAKLVAAKCLASNGSGSLSAVYMSFQFVNQLSYFVDNLKVISFSVGSRSIMSKIWDAVLAELATNGIIVVKSSGNDAENMDFERSDTTAYAFFDNVVIVNAMDRFHQPASFTNYGYVTDVFAPGVNIMSTAPNALPGMYAAEADEYPIAMVNGDLTVSGDEFIEGAVPVSGYSKAWLITEGAITAGAITATASEAGLGFNDVLSMGVDLYFTDEDGEIIPNPNGFKLYFAMKSNATSSGRYGWLFNDVNTRFSIAFDEGVFENYFVYDNGTEDLIEYMFILVAADSDAEIPQGLSFRMSDLQYGRDMVAYEYLSGTSMAAPFVAGCAAVMYDRLLSSGRIRNDKWEDKTEEALILANAIKASVTPVDALDICAQGGFVDMTLDEADFTPVINEMFQSDEAKIRIKGEYFGNDPGTVQIATLWGEYVPAEVVSWNNDDIEIVISDDLISNANFFKVRVTAANGRNGEAIEEFWFYADNIYEMSNWIEDFADEASYSTQLLGVNGKICIFTENDFGEVVGPYVLNPDDQSVYLSDPDRVNSIFTSGRVFTMNDEIWLYGAKYMSAEDLMGRTALYRYEGQGRWESHSVQNISSVINRLGQSPAAYGFDFFAIGDHIVCRSDIAFTDANGQMLYNTCLYEAVRDSFGNYTLSCIKDMTKLMNAALGSAQNLNTLNMSSGYGDDKAIFIVNPSSIYDSLFPQWLICEEDGELVIKTLNNKCVNMPEALTAAYMGLTIGDNKVIISGLHYYDDPELTEQYDTYILDLSDENAVYEPYDKRLSTASVYDVVTLYYNGILYSIYNSNLEYTRLNMRSTQVEEGTVPVKGTAAKETVFDITYKAVDLYRSHGRKGFMAAAYASSIFVSPKYRDEYINTAEYLMTQIDDYIAMHTYDYAEASSELTAQFIDYLEYKGYLTSEGMEIINLVLERIDEIVDNLGQQMYVLNTTEDEKAEALQDVRSGIAEAIERVNNGIKEGIKKAAEGIKEFFDPVSDALKKLLPQSKWKK